MITITITVETKVHSQKIQEVLQEAEDYGELDFPFGYKVDEIKDPE